MSSRISPIRPDEGQQWWAFSYSLESVIFTIVFGWQERNGSWYVSVYDSDGEAIVVGRRLSINYPVLDRLKSDSLPPGRLWLLSSDGSYNECGFDEIGNRCPMVYTPSDEVVS